MARRKGWLTNPKGPLARQEVRAIPKQKSKSNRSRRTSAERQLIAEVFVRDKRCHLCGSPVPIGMIPHHIVHKDMGGRGDLKELVDSYHLRVLLCDECHRKAHFEDGSVNPYVFYRRAISDGYHERVILLEILIDEWAGYIPASDGDLAHEIRGRNRGIWLQVVGNVPIYSGVIGEYWREFLEVSL